MVKHKIYADMFGLTQLEMAILLNVSRSHWSHFVRGVKNLPSKASLLVSQMTLFMISDEARATENMPSTEKGESRATQLLSEQQDEIKFQLSLISRKIYKEQQLKDRFLQAVKTTAFLSKKAEKENTAPHQLLNGIAEVADLNLQDAVFRLNCLQAQEQLLKVQYEWLQKHTEKLKT